MCMRIIFCTVRNTVKKTCAKYCDGCLSESRIWNQSSILFALAAVGIHASVLLRKVMATVRFSEALKASNNWLSFICRVFILCGAYPHNSTPNFECKRTPLANRVR